jgi:hypothetical protein
VIFATGYTRSTIPPELADLPRLEKPVDLAALCRAVEQSVFGDSRRRDPTAAADR